VFESKEEILSQLAAGEDSFAEFKEIRMGDTSVISPNAEDFAGEVIAFANAEGGTLFLGVADDGAVVGLPDDALRKVESWAINVASHNCDPPVRPTFRSVVLPGADGEPRRILLVHVKQGLYVHRTQGGRWYVRVGSSKRDLTQAELSRLFQERGRTFVFDETPVLTATADELDQDLLQRTLGDPRGIDRSQLLQNRRVLRLDADGVLRPTVAGLLCFGHRPADNLPGAWIQTAVYRGERRHAGDAVHSDQIHGPLSQQIDDAVAFVARFMLKPSTKTVGRKDYPQYLLGPVQEAIVNAVAHRDYSIAGSKIRLQLFSDRLELSNPGDLPNTLTLESMPYRQFTRNQLLVSFLSRMRSRFEGRFFMEERGEGVSRILEECTEHSGRTPVYDLHGSELRLTIWAQPSPHESAA